MLAIPLTVIILTFNEGPNIGQCLQSLSGWASEVLLLDAGSTDNTAEIATKAGAMVFENSFVNYGQQRQHALQYLPISHDWILFLDADEYVTDALKTEISTVIQDKNQDCNGYFIAFKFIFLNQWIRHGGYYPTYVLRLFRQQQVERIDRAMDEQIRVRGSVGYLREPFIHHDRKGVRHWYEKHTRYANFQATEQLLRYHHRVSWRKAWRHQRERKRWIKEHIWVFIPSLLRPFLYFFYRYIWQRGFLDGRVGFIFHFSHAFLYPFMTAALYAEKTQEVAIPQLVTRPQHEQAT